MLLMQDPEQILIDELVPGMSENETKLTAKMLQSISEDLTVLFVEHYMEFIIQKKIKKSLKVI